MELEQLKVRYPGAITFTFGDSETLCNELLALARSGRKTATCDALRIFALDDEHLPVVGRADIALNWDGTPALVVRTTEVALRRFCDVDEDFALDEGEDDDLESWRRSHQQYFERSGGFDNEMMLVCERFELIEDVSKR